jgi:hypothetical protein
MILDLPYLTVICVFGEGEVADIVSGKILVDSGTIFIAKQYVPKDVFTCTIFYQAENIGG